MDDKPEDGSSPTRASFRGADCYRIWMDGPVLRIDASGVWDAFVAQAYVRDISRIVTDLRSVQPRIRAIVDRTAAPVFGEGVADILLSAYRDILTDGDRVAIVVDSSLSKGQIRKIAGREETEMFLSVATARTWVLAYG